VSVVGWINVFVCLRVYMLCRNFENYSTRWVSMFIRISKQWQFLVAPCADYYYHVSLPWLMYIYCRRNIVFPRCYSHLSSSRIKLPSIFDTAHATYLKVAITNKTKQCVDLPGGIYIKIKRRLFWTQWNAVKLATSHAVTIFRFRRAPPVWLPVHCIKIL